MILVLIEEKGTSCCASLPNEKRLPALKISIQNVDSFFPGIEHRWETHDYFRPQAETDPNSSYLGCLKWPHYRCNESWPSLVRCRCCNNLHQSAVSVHVCASMPFPVFNNRTLTSILVLSKWKYYDYTHPHDMNVGNTESSAIQNLVKKWFFIGKRCIMESIWKKKGNP